MFLPCLFVLCLDIIFIIFYAFPLSYSLYISEIEGGFFYIINWMLVCYLTDTGGLLGGRAVIK